MAVFFLMEKFLKILLLSNQMKKILLSALAAVIASGSLAGNAANPDAVELLPLPLPVEFTCDMDSPVPFDADVTVTVAAGTESRVPSDAVKCLVTL